MKTCPKCGFVQPPDRFCANCGVNMSAYKPPKPPLLKRLADNIYLQLLAIALLVFLGIDYILKSKDIEEIEPASRVEQYQEASYQESNQPPASETLVAKQVEPTYLDKLAAQRPPVPMPPQKAAATGEEKNTGDDSLRISLSFAMISPEQLESLLENSVQRNELGGGAVSGLLRTARFKLSTDQNLGSTPAKKLSPQQDLTFDSTSKKSRNSQQFLGLITRIFPTSVGLNGLQLGVEIGTNFFSPEVEDSGPELRVLNTSFQFRAGEMPYIIGALPRRMPQIATTDAFFTRGPFGIYSYEEFLEGQAEFIILFHIEGLREN